MYLRTTAALAALTFLAVALSLSACGEAPGMRSSETSTPPAAAATGDRADAGTPAIPDSEPRVVEVVEPEAAELEVAVGDRVLVRFSERLGTGYRWQLVDRVGGDGALAADVEERTTDTAPVEGGASGRSFLFTAAAPGREALVFEYRRPFGDAGPERRGVVGVFVTAR
jgi:predicted secreted protein